MEPPQVKVLLFRAPSDSEGEDKYHKVLDAFGLEGTSIPVLSFEFHNLERLQELITCPSEHSGLIFTSIRAVEAMSACITTMLSNDDWKMIYQPGWQKLSTFVVGEATSRAAIEKLGLKSAGQDSGSAVMVVPLIMQVVPPGSKPILYPCGNLRRDTIPMEMAKAGIHLNSIEVYKTCKHPDITENLQLYVKEKGAPSVLVFFSPSGVEYILPILLEIVKDLSQIKMVAIGKTTQEAMEKKGLAVSGTPDKPNPESLAQCIVHIYER